MYLNMILYLFISSCFTFSYFYKHILLSLISLEFMMINMLYNIYFNTMINESSNFIIALILGVSVCESVLGLSILINMVRMSGNDYMNNMNITKC